MVFEFANSTDVDGHAVLKLSGVLDETARETLLQAGLQAVDNSASGTLIFDVTSLEFVDSTGLGVMITLVQAADQRGQQVRFRRPGQQLLRLLNLTGLDSVFTIEAEPMLKAEPQ